MIRTLREFYGLQPAPPPDLFQFCVWEILSERALPARRDLAWQALRRIPALTPDAMFRAPANDLLEALGTAGPYREHKLERMRATVGEFRRHRERLQVDRLRRVSPLAAARALRVLTQLHRDVRARAHLFVLDAAVFPFDEPMRRVVSRLEVGSQRSFRAALRNRWRSRLGADPTALKEAVIYLRHHAQQTCVELAPHCGVCPLRPACEFARRGVNSVMRRGDVAP